MFSDGDGKGADLRIKGSVLLISGGIRRRVGIRELGGSRTVPLVFNNEFKLPSLARVVPRYTVNEPERLTTT